MVDAGRVVQVQEVLNLDDDGVRDALVEAADHLVVQLLALEDAEVPHHPVDLPVGAACEEARQRLVVVRADVGDAVRCCVVVRKVRVRRVAADAELHHLHARIPAGGDEVLHGLREDAQVLGDDLRALRGLVDDVGELLARAFEPFAALGGFAFGGDRPVVDDADEVVDANHVEELRVGLHALAPPLKILLLHHVPAVQRVAPALALVGKCIRRYSGNVRRIAVDVQLEELAVRPGIGAVHGDVQRNVADNLHALLRRVRANRVPLREEHKLHKLLERHFRSEALLRPLQGGFLVKL